MRDNQLVEKTNHTKEPWVVHKVFGGWQIVSSKDPSIVIAEIHIPDDDEEYDIDVLRDNGKRIIGCVNALSGIVDPPDFVRKAFGVAAFYVTKGDN